MSQITPRSGSRHHHVARALWQTGSSLASRYAQRAAPYLANHAYEYVKRKISSQKRRPRKKHQPQKMEHTEEIRGAINRYSMNISIPYKHHEKVLGHLRQTQTYDGTLEPGPGRQIVTTLFSVNSISQAINNSGVGYNTEQNEICYFDLNLNQPTNNPTFGGVLRPSDDRIIFRHFEIDLTFTNMANVPTIVDVYLVKCKGATSMNPYVAWNQGYLDTAQNQATAIQATRTTVSVAGYPDNTFYDTRPYESPTFKRFWQVLGVETLNMAADQTDKLYVGVKLNKLLKKEYIAGLTKNNLAGVANNNLYHTGTFFIMTVTRSACVQLQQSLSNRCTFSDAKVGFVAKVTTHFQQVADNTSRVNLNRVDYNIVNNPNPTTVKIGPQDVTVNYVETS